MANVDGQIILGLDINATAANIQTGINKILNTTKVRQIVLKTAIEKSETEKSIQSMVDKINKETIKLGVEVNAKDVHNILAEQLKISSTQADLIRQMQEYRNVAEDIGIILNKSTGKEFNNAIKAENFSKAKEIIKSVKQQIDEYNKAVKVMNSDTSITGSVSSVINKFTQLKNVSSETQEKIETLKNKLKNFEEADTSKNKLTAYQALKSCLADVTNEYSRLNTAEKSNSNDSVIRNKIKDAETLYSIWQKVYLDLGDNEFSSQLNTAISNLGEELGKLDKTASGGKLKEAWEQIENAVNDVNRAIKEYNVENDKINFTNKSVKKDDSIKGNINDAKTFYSTLQKIYANLKDFPSAEGLNNAIKSFGSVLNGIDATATGNKLDEEWKKVEISIKNVNRAIKEYKAEQSSLGGLSEKLDLISNNSLSYINSIENSPVSGIGTKNLINDFTKLINRVTELQEKLSNIDSSNGDGIKNLSKEVDELYSQFSKFSKEGKIFDDINSFSTFTSNVEKARQKIEAYDKTYSAIKSRPDLVKELGQLKEKAEQISTPSELKQWNKEFDEFNTKVIAAGKHAASFADKLKKAFENFASFFSASRIIYEVIEKIKQVIENISQLDSAMVELRKVTDASENEFVSFLERTKQKAVELGATVTDLVSATADFSRLGFSLKDAEKLGEVATIYANVGDDVENIEQATSSLISIMKGFNIEASNAESIIDKLNEVGNNFAISSGGIGDALQRSSAALSAAGNSIDESIGLIVAANNVIQDSDTVGTMWKTVSMRIRSAKTELEEAGLETEYMATSTAALRDTILGITNIDGGGGFDILTDSGAFKSTYDIILGIGEVWDELGKKDPVGQSALLELLAGKRQGNALAAALTNINDMTKAYETSLNSAGSAAQEYEVWLDSIEAKTQQFQASFEVLSSTMISDDFIKTIIDEGTDILTFLDELINSCGGLINTITLLGLALGVLNFSKTVNTMSGLWASLQTGFGLFGKLTKRVNIFRSALASTKEIVGFGAKIKSFTSILTGTSAALSFATAGIMALVAAVGIGVAWYQSWKQKQEEQRQAAQESAQAYQETTISVDEYKNKITELRKEIDSGNLSEEEAYNKRQDLISIQKTLIEMFGDEAEAINLVTGEINTQIATIDKLSKTQWEDWKSDHEGAKNDAITAITNPTNSSNGLKASISGKIVYKTGKLDDELLNRLKNELGMTTATNLHSGSTNLLFSDDSIDDIYSLIDAYGELFRIVDEYRNEVKKSGGDTSYYDDFLENISKIKGNLKALKDEHEDIFNTYAEGQLLYGEVYSKTWSKVLAAQKEYDEAVLSGDNQAIQDAVKKMNAAEVEFGKLNIDDEAVALYAEDYFEKFNAETKKHKATIELSTDDSEIKNLAQNAVKTFEDESGKVDLHSVLNVGTEYENLSDGAKRNKILTEEEQAYVELKYAANEYGVSVEDLLVILDELGYVELDVAAATDDLGSSINSLSDSISTLDSMSDLGETMNSIIGSLKDGDRLQFDDLKSLSEQMTELGLSTDEYLEKLLDAGDSADEVQNVFAEITNELISQKVASGELTEADEQMLAVWLESIGVANAAKIAHEALAVDKNAVAEAEAKLANVTEGTISSVYEEIAAMMSEQGVTQATKQKLFELALQKLRVNENEIVTSSDIEQLIAFADAADATAASLENLAQAKAYYAEAERLDKLAESASTERGKGEAKSQANSYRQLAEQWANKPIEYEKINPDDFIITPTGNGSGGSSGSGKDANLDAWEKLVKQKKHLVETDQMTQEQYYDWLRSEYKSHLSDTEKYADELMSIEKELYDWEKQRIQASIDDELAVLDNQKAKGLISEEEYFKKLNELYSDGYSELQQAVEEHNLYGVDNTERLQAETEFLEKVKDAHNSAYDAERQALDHKLAMNLISEEQYLIELQRLYDQYYKGQDMYSEEAMEIEEELYDKRVELVEKWADAAVEAVEAIASATEESVSAVTNFIEGMVDAHEESFNLEKGLLDHYLAMNYITEEQYYDRLESLNKRYFMDKRQYTKQFWENQEAIYQHEQDALEESASAIEDIHGNIVDMIKDELEDAIDSIEKTKEKYLDLINVRREALNDKKDEDDYHEERDEQLSNIADLERQLDALSRNTSAAGIKKYKEIYAALQKAKKSYAEFEEDHAYDVMNTQLDNEEAEIESKFDTQTAELETALNNNEHLVQEAWNRMADMNSGLFNQLEEYTKKHSTSIKDDLTDSWNAASEAVGKYKTEAQNAYDIINQSIGQPGITDTEALYDYSITDRQQFWTYAKPVTDLGASMLTTITGLASDLAGVLDSVVDSPLTGLIATGAGTMDVLAGAGAGILTSILGLLTGAGFASGTNYVPKTGIYRTDELGNEFKFIKDSQGNQYRLLTEGSKVIDANKTENFMKIVRNPDLFANTIKNQILSEIDATRSISNVVDSSSNEVNINNEFIIQSADPKGVAAEVEKLMPQITKQTINHMVGKANNLGIKQKIQHKY